MKKVKRYNVLLLILMGLCGISLGASVALLVLSLGDNRSIYSLGGLICAIITAALTLLLPFLTHFRDVAIERTAAMLETFGREVPFYSEKEFYKVVANRRKAHRLYALHPGIKKNIGDLRRKEMAYALSEAVATHLGKAAIIAYVKQGDYVFYTQMGEEKFLELFKLVDEDLAKNPRLPSYSLLLGGSSSKEGYPKMFEEALFAALENEEGRDSLSYERKHDKEEAIESIDLKREEEQGRLFYNLVHFEDSEKLVDDKFNLFSPTLYDSLRGDIEGKDLFHMVSLYKLRHEMDAMTIDRGIRYLVDNPEDDGVLIFRIGDECVADQGFIPTLYEKIEKYGIDPKRVGLGYFAPAFGNKDSKESARKAYGVGFRVGVYDYGGEAIENLIKAHAEFAFMKPEILRKNADERFLRELVGGLVVMGVNVLIEDDCAYAGYSYLKCYGKKRLETVEDRPIDEEEGK